MIILIKSTIAVIVFSLMVISIMMVFNKGVQDLEDFDEMIMREGGIVYDLARLRDDYDYTLAKAYEEEENIGLGSSNVR